MPFVYLTLPCDIFSQLVMNIIQLTLKLKQYIPIRIVRKVLRR